MPVAVSTKDKTWNKMFPTTFKTEQQSLVFMKKLFAVAISNIVYIRSIFPEYAFFDKQLEGIKLKILREDSKCPGASKVINWVRGCFDALDKRYLKTVIIGFYTDPNDPDTVIESYSFKFTYSVDGVSVKLDTENRAASNIEAIVKNDDTPEEIKKATLSLLRTMILAGNTQDQLPDKVIVTMKLLYYDEVTPDDYEPNGFKTSDYAGFRHETETINAKLGHVDTDFHSFRMILRTDKASFTENYLKGASNKNGTDPEPEEIKSLKETPCSANNTRSPCVASTSAVNVECEEEFHVRCPCGGNKDDGIMIMCEMCKNWQHSVCFCLTEEEAVPDSHICDMCTTENSDLVCTDPRLGRLNPEERQELCLIRRSLVHCRSVDVIEPGQLSEILGVEIPVGNGLFCALQNDGVLINPKRRSKNKGLCKVVDKVALENCLMKKYFHDGDSVELVVPVPDPPKNSRKRNNAVASLSASTNNISLEDNSINILNASQDSMLNDLPQKKKRRACVVKTPVVASRH